MKIQLKRSRVLEGDNAKQPSAGQMEYGELAVNYNEGDPAIFLKDSDNAIVRIAGAGALGGFSGDYNDLTNKPDLFSGDYNDLDNKLVGGDGIRIYTNSTVEAEGYTTYGIEVEAQGIRLGDDWSDIPTRA